MDNYDQKSFDFGDEQLDNFFTKITSFTGKEVGVITPSIANVSPFLYNSGAISGAVGSSSISYGHTGTGGGNGAGGPTGNFNVPNGFYNAIDYNYPTITFSDNTYNWNSNASQALDVKGDANFEGDVKIKGKSLNDTLDRIEQRLALLTGNSELEGKWDELKQLGDKYRELEKEILEKQKMWDILKK